MQRNEPRLFAGARLTRTSQNASRCVRLQQLKISFDRVQDYRLPAHGSTAQRAALPDDGEGIEFFGLNTVENAELICTARVYVPPLDPKQSSRTMGRMTAREE